jgi:hypothetical protein
MNLSGADSVFLSGDDGMQGPAERAFEEFGEILSAETKAKLDGLASRVAVIPGPADVLETLADDQAENLAKSDMCLWSYRIPLTERIVRLLKQFPNCFAALPGLECPCILVTIALTQEEFAVLTRPDIDRLLVQVVDEQIETQLSFITNFLIEQETAASGGDAFNPAVFAEAFHAMLGSCCVYWQHFIPASIEKFVADTMERAALAEQSKSGRRWRVGWTVFGGVVTGGLAIGTTIATGGLAAPALAAVIWVGVKSIGNLVDEAVRANALIETNYHNAFVQLEALEDAFLDASSEGAKTAASIGKSAATGLLVGLGGSLAGQLVPSFKQAERYLEEMTAALEASLEPIEALPVQIAAVNTQMQDLLKMLPDVPPEKRDETLQQINGLLAELAALDEQLELLRREFEFWGKIRLQLSAKLKSVKEAESKAAAVLGGAVSTLAGLGPAALSLASGDPAGLSDALQPVADGLDVAGKFFDAVDFLKSCGEEIKDRVREWKK